MYYEVLGDARSFEVGCLRLVGSFGKRGEPGYAETRNLGFSGSGPLTTVDHHRSSQRISSVSQAAATVSNHRTSSPVGCWFLGE